MIGQFLNFGHDGAVVGGSRRGRGASGERAEVIYTLISTAKLNGLNPEAYLYHVLERLGDHPINRVD